MVRDLYAEGEFKSIYDTTKKTRSGDLILVIPKEIAEGLQLNSAIKVEADAHSEDQAEIVYSTMIDSVKCSIVFMEDGSINTYTGEEIQHILWLHNELDFLKLYNLISSYDDSREKNLGTWERKDKITKRIQELEKKRVTECV